MTRVFRSGINYTSNGLNGVTLLSSLSQLITRRPIRARPAGLLFIYTHRWKWQRAGSSDQTSNTGTLQHIVPLRRAPNQHPALSDTGIYTLSGLQSFRPSCQERHTIRSFGGGGGGEVRHL